MIQSMSNFMRTWLIESDFSPTKGHQIFAALHPCSPSNMNSTVAHGRDTETPGALRAKYMDAQVMSHVLKRLRTFKG